MKNAALLVTVVVVVAVAARVDGRAYYLGNLDGPRNYDALYPIVEPQASRDLDLSFSAGDPLESENAVSPVKKVYTVVAPEKPRIELSRDADRPVAYYRLTGPSGGRSGFDDVLLVPQTGRRLKLNGGNKGEVILELRVVANHDSA